MKQIIHYHEKGKYLFRIIKQRATINNIILIFNYSIRIKSNARNLLSSKRKLILD